MGSSSSQSKKSEEKCRECSKRNIKDVTDGLGWSKAVEICPSFKLEPAGFWIIECDTTPLDSRGITELDIVWDAVKDLISEKVFIQATYDAPDSHLDENEPNDCKIVEIHCYVEYYFDTEHVMRSADEIRKRVHYPYPLYMKTNSFRNRQLESDMKYLYCADGDLYEYSKEGFRITERSRVTTTSLSTMSTITKNRELVMKSFEDIHFFKMCVPDGLGWHRAVENIPSFMLEPAGFWIIECDTTPFDKRDITELDIVWHAVKYLIAKKIFIQAVYDAHAFHLDENQPNGCETVIIRCYIKDYHDIEHVMRSADALRNRVHYPYPLCMGTKSVRGPKIEYVLKYLYCADEDLYEYSKEGFRVIRRCRTSTRL